MLLGVCVNILPTTVRRFMQLFGCLGMTADTGLGYCWAIFKVNLKFIKFRMIRSRCSRVAFNSHIITSVTSVFSITVLFSLTVFARICEFKFRLKANVMVCEKTLLLKFTYRPCTLNWFLIRIIFRIHHLPCLLHQPHPHDFN